MNEKNQKNKNFLKNAIILENRVDAFDPNNVNGLFQTSQMIKKNQKFVSSNIVPEISIDDPVGKKKSTLQKKITLEFNEKLRESFQNFAGRSYISSPK